MNKPAPPAQILQQAAHIIEQLKPLHDNNRLMFDMNCNTYLSGRENTVLRQAVMYRLTNEMPAPANCTVSHISSQLSGYFNQSKLF